MSGDVPLADDAATYMLDNVWENAHQRLTLLEAVYDPATTGRLAQLGVGPGWRCLELGAGAGSIARWLCDRVGADGRVVAVDLEPRFLAADPRPNLDVVRCDIVADGIPGDGYDLIHTRALLVHLPQRDELLPALVLRLRPGGIILLEEGDAYPIATASSPIYTELWDRAFAAMAKGGADATWGRHLPARLAAAGAVDVAAAGDVQMFTGGSPYARFAILTMSQLTPMLVADGMSPERIAEGIAELSDPSRWFPGAASIAAWGHRPE